MDLIPAPGVFSLADSPSPCRALGGRCGRVLAWPWHGVAVLNALGTLDADYRGEVTAIPINFG